MKVILKDDIEKLGAFGQIVNVADGYARNYLIPKKLAMEATPHALNIFEQQAAKRTKLMEVQKQDMQKIAATLSALVLTIPAHAGDEGKLFGSVTTSDIADALLKAGQEIDKKRIILDEPIKALGEYTVTVKLHPEVTAAIKVIVTAETAD